MITDDEKLAQTFNKYFVNFVPCLRITSFRENNYDVNNDNIDIPSRNLRVIQT